MLKNFKDFLIEQGYSEFTPSGKPSTVYDYVKRVEKICDRENITIISMSNNIGFYVERYGPTGYEAEFRNYTDNELHYSKILSYKVCKYKQITEAYNL